MSVSFVVCVCVCVRACVSASARVCVSSQPQHGAVMWQTT